MAQTVSAAPAIVSSPDVIHEKIFAQTDKTVYMPGEIAWFRLFTVDANSHRSCDLSKIAYAELLDANNKAIWQGKIAVVNGQGSGSFIMSAQIHSGNYIFRVYTNWMKNFPADEYFHKIITVINTSDTYIPDNTSAKKASVDFFPEGGYLLNNVVSTVGFIVSSIGRGIEGTGFITDNGVDTIQQFSTHRDGLGHFTFSPVIGKHYTAKVALKDGTLIEQILPEVHEAGYVMKLDRNHNLLTIAINSTFTGIAYVVVHASGKTIAVKAATLNNGHAKFEMSVDSLPPGLSTFTLFNGKGEPQCERLYFNAPQRKLQFTLRTDKQNYEQRKKINLAISASDEVNKTIDADVALSIYKIDSLQRFDEKNIAEYFWLTSGMHGNVENASYYLENTGDTEHIISTNDLMLTHGWRTFNSLSAPGRSPLAFAPEYYGHLITGNVTDTRTGKAAPGVNTYVSMPGIRTLYSNAVSDSTGTVKLEIKNLYGNELIAQAGSLADTNYTVEIETPFSSQFSKAPITAYRIPLNTSGTLAEHSITAQVARAYLASQQNIFDSRLSDTLPTYQQPEFRYMLDDYKRFTSVEEVLREFVRNVFVSKDHGHYRLSVFREASQTTLPGTPLVLMDGVPVFNIDKVIGFDPLKINIVDVIARKYYFGNMEYDGVVNFITYDGLMDGYELDKNAVVVDYEGLQLQRHFYSPSYEDNSGAKNHLPDFRNVLLWNPSLHLHGSANNLTFFSSDISGKFIAIVQGITRDGRSGAGTISFTVNTK